MNILKLVVRKKHLRQRIQSHCVTTSRSTSETQLFHRSKQFRQATMAPILLRSLARTARTTTASRLLRRNLTTSIVARQESLNEDGNRKTGFDYHTVEDYHGMSAHEILSGPKEDPKMRHFTGEIVAKLRETDKLTHARSQLRVRQPSSNEGWSLKTV